MKNPIYYLANCLCFVSIAVLTASAQSKPETADATTLRYMKEVEWPKAYREQDTRLLDRILADEFQMIDGSGEWSNKKKELEYIAANKPTYASFRFEIKRLDIFENGTAVVAGTGHIVSRDKDGTFRMEYQSSNVLIKRNGVWKAILSHVSGIKRITDPGQKVKE